MLKIICEIEFKDTPSPANKEHIQQVLDNDTKYRGYKVKVVEIID
jgi:hypothetical protein